MGVFDKSLCNCCISPMQSVMQQLVNRNSVFFSTISGPVNVSLTINSANNFIANTTGGLFPICNVTAVGVNNDSNITLKPVRQDKKGECSCCEDPATNELQSLIGKEVDIEYIGDTAPFSNTGTVKQVGEGIVVIATQSATFSNIVISTCQVTRIEDLS